MDAVQHVLDGAVHRVLAGLDGQALVAHVLQGDDLFLHFLLGQLFPGDVLVLLVVGTVQTAVDAVVGQVQRREDDNAVAVEILFDLLGQGVQLLDLLGDVAGQQHRGLPVRQALALPGLVQNLVDELHVLLVLVGVGQGVQDFLVVDKFLGFQRLGIVHTKHPFFWVRNTFPSGFYRAGKRAVVTGRGRRGLPPPGSRWPPCAPSGPPNAGRIPLPERACRRTGCTSPPRREGTGWA